MTPRNRLGLLSLCLWLLVGCATLPPGPRDPRDPWERMNRTTYRINDAFDRAILKPVAKGYRKVTPGVVQTGVRNFFDNLSYPVVMLNDLLQGQFKPFVYDSVRLVVNTTLGIGGILDPATVAGLDKNDRDFGQTLGKWGVKSGPYVVLPFLGPCDVRDSFGKLADEFSSPRHYIRNRWVDYGFWVVDNVDIRARLLDLDPLIQSAYDPYAFVRRVYLQHRDFKVNGGASDEEQERQERELEKAAAEDDAAPMTPAPASAAPAAPPGQPPQTPPPR
jgi:phospholipid-binding lipoprotein MlaA